MSRTLLTIVPLLLVAGCAATETPASMAPAGETWMVIGRPSLRIWTHGLEMLVLVPLAGILGAKWGATGAAGAVLASSVAFCVYWTFLYLRIRREPEPAAQPVEPVAA